MIYLWTFLRVDDYQSREPMHLPLKQNGRTLLSKEDNMMSAFVFVQVGEKELPMPNRIGPVLSSAVAMGALLLVSCGANEASIAVEQRISPPASTRAPTPIGEPSQTTEETPLSIGECEEPATEIALGSPVSSEIVGSNQPPREQKYFCVRVPDGASSITFDLTSTTSDLNLYVGHPDLETVQQGGIWFWSTNERGVEDKVIVVEPALTDYVNPGPYYIEVSAEDFRESSPFTLSARTP